MTLTDTILSEINTLCKKYNVASLYLFGSATGTQFREDSDVDFLVSFKPIDLSNYFTNFLSLKEELKKLLKRDVDLVEEQTLRNPILISSINKNKKLLYG